MPFWDLINATSVANQATHINNLVDKRWLMVLYVLINFSLRRSIPALPSTFQRTVGTFPVAGLIAR